MQPWYLYHSKKCLLILLVLYPDDTDKAPPPGEEEEIQVGITSVERKASALEYLLLYSECVLL